jgi:hypothetical protein
MDDFTSANFYEARNEYAQRLLNILTPQILNGIDAICNKSYDTCVLTNEQSNYYSAFQNALSAIAKWNSVIIHTECNRIIEKSHCTWIEDLITCVHLVQVKVLTCIRVGNRQKKIDVVIPKIDTFIHNVYIFVARKLYSNIYLMEKTNSGLVMQRNRRELEIIIQDCIMNVIRESIPTEQIIRAYMDESIEEEEEITIEPVPMPDECTPKTPLPKPIAAVDNTEKSDDIPMVPIEPSISNLNNEPVITRLTFNDVDYASDGGQIHAPKSIERLESLGEERQQKRRDEAEDSEPLMVIGDQNMSVDDLFNFDTPSSPRHMDTNSLDSIGLDIQTI